MGRVQDIIKAEEYRKEGYPAIFVGQSRTRLVQGRSKWKVENTHAPCTENPRYTSWSQENHPRDFTELEKMYNEFCKKAYDYLACHSTNNGINHPYRIIFPHFYYEIIPQEFPIE